MSFNNALQEINGWELRRPKGVVPQIVVLKKRSRVKRDENFSSIGNINCGSNRLGLYRDMVSEGAITRLLCWGRLNPSPGQRGDRIAPTRAHFVLIRTDQLRRCWSSGLENGRLPGCLDALQSSPLDRIANRS